MVDAVALSENTGKKIFILFTANWCPSCRCIKEDIENNEKVLDDYIVYYIDYDKNPELIKEYKVKKIPDYLIIEDKIEIKRNIGYFGFDMFKKWLKHNE
jgi:thiol-disulfide isomerase/thioredoxin